MRDVEAKIHVVNGDTVRSFLERKWALFFKYLNINFIYEPERLPDGVSAIGYLPDFLIHEKLYLEIKPSIEIARQELNKPYGFVRETNKRLLVVVGDPPGETIIAVFKQKDGSINTNDVSWISWESLDSKTDIDICRETAAANYAKNEVIIGIETPIARCVDRFSRFRK
jgi:hypothetical protein